MSKIDDGGSAFPLPDQYRLQEMGSGYGMSLRDYFAGQALAGVLANPFYVEAAYEAKANDFVDMMATKAYVFADAMLAVRKAGA